MRKMKGSIPNQDQSDLFRNRLTSIISLDHELSRLAEEIDWECIDAELDGYYAREGRPSIPVRTMVGMLLLKRMYDQSDESVLARWVENPYWQYFTGETYFQHRPPFDPTDFVYFRKRVGEAGMEKILSLTVRLHCGSEVEEEVLVDTTVQEKNVTFPTDTKLALKIINYCWAYGDREGVEWRQSYRFVVKRLRLATYNGSHPRRRRGARRAQRKLRTIAGRLVRDLRRKLSAEALAYYTETLDLFEQVLGQRRGTKNKRYSLHEPAVWCIAKGKVHKKYEFGCKVSVARTALSGIVVGMKSFVGNPYDGDTLAPALAQVERVREDAGGERPRIAVVDRGYRGRKYLNGTDVLIPGRGTKEQTYYEKQKQRKRFRRRAGIEPVIGHLKEDHRMRRNFLSGELGDAVNCLLAGAAFNMMKRLNQLKMMPIMAWLIVFQVAGAICIRFLSPKHHAAYRSKEYHGYALAAV